MEQLSDYFAFENAAKFDIERRLKWSNQAIICALEYYRDVCGESVTYDQMMDELHAGALRPIQALLFGALKAADAKMNMRQFEKIYKPDYLTDYVASVIDGMLRYLPEPEIKDTGENLDPDWPDTQSEVKKKTLRTPKTGVFGFGSAAKTISTLWTRLCGR